MLLLAGVCMQVGVKAQIQKGADIDGENTGDQAGTAVSMPDANTIAIGAPFNYDAPDNVASGHVRVFRWDGSAWVRKGADIQGEHRFDMSGTAVSMPDPNTVAIGATDNGDGGSIAGHVRVFRWDGNAWIQKGADIDGEEEGDKSGWAVSMPDPNTVAIGAPYNTDGGDNAGHVRIYQWDGNAWIRKGTDIDGTGSDQLGWSVSMPDANTVAIGAPGINNAGHVRVYQWNGSAWTQKGTDIRGEGLFDQSGRAVSMPDANTVAIGAPRNDDAGPNAGHVRVYRWNGSAWVQKGADIQGEQTGDQLGTAVSMPDTNTVAIGAPRNDDAGQDAGHVRVYRWDGSAWVRKGTDIDGEAADDWSGQVISMPDTNTLAIGAHRNDDAGQDAGHVRVYEFEPTTGIIENNLGYKPVIYPHPIGESFTIDLGEKQRSVTLRITDLNDRVVYSGTHRNTHRIHIPFKGPAGMYYATLRSNNRKAVIRLVKE